MKKIKGTRYAHIGKSYHPALDELEEQVKAQGARLDALIAKVKEMIAEPKS